MTCTTHITIPFYPVEDAPAGMLTQYTQDTEQQCDYPKITGVFFLTKYAAKLLVNNPDKFIKYWAKKNKKSIRIS